MGRTRGVVSGKLLLEVADRSDAILHLERRYTYGELALQRDPRGTDTENVQLLWPRETDVIERVAMATGGTVHHPQNDESMVAAVTQILDEFRQSYVLHYQPTGVTSGGWHRITVRVTRPGKYDVQARRGYFGG